MIEAPGYASVPARRTYNNLWPRCRGRKHERAVINERRIVRSAASLTSSFTALVGISLLAGAVAAAYFGMRTVNETLRVERLALRQVADIEGLKASLKAAEAIQREYLITGEAVLVARFETQRERIRLHLSELRTRIEDPEQRAAMPTLARAVTEWLAATEQTMDGLRSSGAKEAVRLAFMPALAAQAERADGLLDQLLKRHRRLVAHREAEAGENLVFLERAMLVGILLGAVLLGWSVRAAQGQEAARQAAETALQARSRELRLLIDAVPATIAYVDPQERVLLHNRAYAEWLGVPSARIEGRGLRELLGETEYAAASPNIGRVLAGETVQYERQQRLDDGSVRDLAVAYVPHRSPAGMVLGYYALLTDITELKGLSRSKSNFVSMVSHELRTPATAIRGALGMLAGGVAGTLPEEAGQLVEIANASCERLVRLVDDIQDIEKIEAGEIAVTLRDEDLSQILRTAVLASAPLAAQRQVRLEPDNVQVGARAHTDRDRAIQVMNNLLSNAIQFSPDGAAVRIGLESRGGMLRIAVRDQGPGVSEEFRPRLFEKFAQDATTARGSTGRFGLGLAVSKLLVDRLGGRIGYEPASGGGSVFWFELPAAAAGGSSSRSVQ